VFRSVFTFSVFDVTIAIGYAIVLYFGQKYLWSLSLK